MSDMDRLILAAVYRLMARCAEHIDLVTVTHEVWVVAKEEGFEINRKKVGEALIKGMGL